MSSELVDALILGFCLMLVMEGIIPFLYPQRWRNLVQQLALVSDRALRLIGLGSMLLGIAILYAVH